MLKVKNTKPRFHQSSMGEKLTEFQIDICNLYCMYVGVFYFTQTLDTIIKKNIKIYF